MSATESWREVEGFEGYYEVSDRGRVRSVDREIAQQSRKGRTYTRRLNGRMLKPSPTIYGHLQVPLRRDGGLFRLLVHRLVLLAFVGPAPEGCECCHNDGDLRNNQLCNLRWGTRRENAKDRYRHGTHGLGERNTAAKLTADDVRTIRGLASAGRSYAALAAAYQVKKRTVRAVVNRENWAHVQ